MFEVTVEESFAAGHALRGYKGKCENVHGHTYKVRVVLAGEKLDSVGLLYDFVALRRQMAEIIGRLDHQFLNDLPPFTDVNPSAENIARYFYDELARRVGTSPNGVTLRAVTVFESDTTTATYRPRS
ncbi:MAG TPA: 6-carboxytetrahydropterin synthase QueD [Candidatus Acidoferrales bacterium]|nr:6-carboxytetrahydropterin synthase QueD [Candidatus Acidoferrales bacterium]